LKQDKSQILENELLLCNKMLKMDERNFHCWNYRLWVVETFLKEHGVRGTGDVFESRQKPLLEEECKMALALIQKNFSNYSAWHYRAKLMPKMKDANGTLANNSYLIPLDTINSDFAMLKHAFFTDPKD
jgi:geranylgeranyl transferase type-2 subunit alpha